MTVTADGRRDFPPMTNILKKTIAKNKSFILHEVQRMHDFMEILMKHKNTGVKWSKDDIRKIKSHLMYLSLYVPVLFVFMLPFGSLLLPVLAEIIDRRQPAREKNTRGD